MLMRYLAGLLAGLLLAVGVADGGQAAPGILEQDQAVARALAVKLSDPRSGVALPSEPSDPSLRAGSELDLVRRQIERDVRLAWLELWLSARSLDWLRRLGEVHEQLIEWGEVAYKAGKLPRDEILKWRALREAVRERESDQHLSRERAHAQLQRWLGAAALGEPTPDLPAPLMLGDAPEASLDRHPELLRVQQAGAALDDRRRTLSADLRIAQAERRVAGERIRRFEQDIVPLQQSREAAALGEYRAGKGSWERVLDARRDLAELRLLWLAQCDAQARAEVQLRYLVGN